MSRFEATVDGLQRRQGELMRTQMQMTSGKRVNLPSDDPTAAARIERAHTAQLRVASEQRSVDVSRNACSWPSRRSVRPAMCCTLRAR